MDIWLIAVISFFTSMLSGMLGLGGAVLLIPAYLYIPELFGLTAPDIKVISGMTSLQVFFSSIAGLLIHKKKGAANNKLILTLGVPIVVSSFAGAFVSGYLNGNIIILVFAFLAVLGAVLLITGKEAADENKVDFNFAGAVLIAVFTGFFGGIAGAPGAFILSPLLMTVLKVPTRITIGSTIGVVIMSSFAASAGKLATNQVDVNLTLIAIIFSIPGVIAGSLLSHRLKVKTLRTILALLVAAIGIEMWITIIFRN